MMSNKLLSLVAVAVLVTVVAGIGYFANQQQVKQDEKTKEEAMPVPSGVEGMKKDEAMMEKKEGEMKKEEGVMMEGYSGKVLADKSSPLLDFVKADYDTAAKSDKLVVLYFYANWCPICKEEVASALYPAFNELTTDKVIGIRINYNDNETDDDERNLAREFGIAYQHTKVILKNGKRVLKSPEAWNKARYTSELTKALGQ